MVIEGFFARFDSRTELWPGVREEIAPGAFARSLQENDIRALVDHESRLVLGRTGAGTLTLEERDGGLWGRVAINPNDQDARNVYARLARGDVSQASFGFIERSKDTMHDADGATVWRLRDVDLREVSVVTFPAYEDTALQARRAEYERQGAEQLQRRKQALKTRLEGLRHGIDADQDP